MLVDSSALPEQVVDDVIKSAFHSAGQRCSALRILFLQEEIADKIMHMLAGAMQELVVGNPGLLVTDVGPVINKGSLNELQEHIERMEQEGRLIGRTPLDPSLAGSFLAPCAFEIDNIGVLTEEVFGPVLHVVRYKSRDLDKVIDEINGTGYGLTLGVHSRIDRTQQHIARRAKVGHELLCPESSHDRGRSGRATLWPWRRAVRYRTQSISLQGGASLPVTVDSPRNAF